MKLNARVRRHSIAICYGLLLVFMPILANGASLFGRMWNKGTQLSTSMQHKMQGLTSKLFGSGVASVKLPTTYRVDNVPAQVYQPQLRKSALQFSPPPVEGTYRQPEPQYYEDSRGPAPPSPQYYGTPGRSQGPQTPLSPQPPYEKPVNMKPVAAPQVEHANSRPNDHFDNRGVNERNVAAGDQYTDDDGSNNRNVHSDRPIRHLDEGELAPETRDKMQDVDRHSPRPPTASDEPERVDHGRRVAEKDHQEPGESINMVVLQQRVDEQHDGDDQHDTGHNVRSQFDNSKEEGGGDDDGEEEEEEASTDMSEPKEIVSGAPAEQSVEPKAAGAVAAEKQNEHEERKSQDVAESSRRREDYQKNDDESTEKSADEGSTPPANSDHFQGKSDSSNELGPDILEIHTDAAESLEGTVVDGPAEDVNREVQTPDYKEPRSSKLQGSQFAKLKRSKHEKASSDQIPNRNKMGPSQVEGKEEQDSAEQDSGLESADDSFSDYGPELENLDELEDFDDQLIPVDTFEVVEKYVDDDEPSFDSKAEPTKAEVENQTEDSPPKEQPPVEVSSTDDDKAVVEPTEDRPSEDPASPDENNANEDEDSQEEKLDHHHREPESQSLDSYVDEQELTAANESESPPKDEMDESKRLESSDIEKIQPSESESVEAEPSEDKRDLKQADVDVADNLLSSDEDHVELPGSASTEELDSDLGDSSESSGAKDPTEVADELDSNSINEPAGSSLVADSEISKPEHDTLTESNEFNEVNPKEWDNRIDEHEITTVEESNSVPDEENSKVSLPEESKSDDDENDSSKLEPKPENNSDNDDRSLHQSDEKNMPDSSNSSEAYEDSVEPSIKQLALDVDPTILDDDKKAEEPLEDYSMDSVENANKEQPMLSEERVIEDEEPREAELSFDHDDAPNELKDDESKPNGHVEDQESPSGDEIDEEEMKVSRPREPMNSHLQDKQDRPLKLDVPKNEWNSEEDDDMDLGHKLIDSHYDQEELPGEAANEERENDLGDSLETSSDSLHDANDTKVVEGINLTTDEQPPHSDEPDDVHSEAQTNEAAAIDPDLDKPSRALLETLEPNDESPEINEIEHSVAEDHEDEPDRYVEAPASASDDENVRDVELANENNASNEEHGDIVDSNNDLGESPSLGEFTTMSPENSRLDEQPMDDQEGADHPIDDDAQPSEESASRPVDEQPIDDQEGSDHPIDDDAQPSEESASRPVDEQPIDDQEGAVHPIDDDAQPSEESASQPVDEQPSSVLKYEDFDLESLFRVPRLNRERSFIGRGRDWTIEALDELDSDDGALDVAQDSDENELEASKDESTPPPAESMASPEEILAELALMPLPPMLSAKGLEKSKKRRFKSGNKMNVNRNRIPKLNHRLSIETDDWNPERELIQRREGRLVKERDPSNENIRTLSKNSGQLAEIVGKTIGNRLITTVAYKPKRLNQTN